ncbi:MAG: oligosaccharide flippase family protein [Candidatus Omnitrophica bacterium]|nr:oligosaccharide flippase family protein [Candidatus Omnitrophota bacterium]
MRRIVRKSYKIITAQDKKIVLENFFSLSALQGITYLIPIAILPYLIRVIGPERLGLIVFAQAFTQYLLILTDYGFSVSATREISLCRQDKNKLSYIFSSVIITRIILTIAGFLTLLATICFIPRFRQDYLVYLLSFGAVIGNALFPVWFFQGTEKMKYVSNINIFSGILAVFCVVIFIKKPADYLLVPLINSLAMVGSGVAGILIVFRRFDIKFVRQSCADIKAQLKSGWNVFISIVAINAYTASRIFAVGLLTNNLITGYYAIAERIVYTIQTFPILSFSQAIYPRINKIYDRNRKRAAWIMQKLQRSTLIVCAIALPVFSLLAPLLSGWMCGVRTPIVISTLQLLLISVLFINANIFKVQYLLVCGKTDIYSRIHLTAALIGMPLIFLSIYLFSYLGAALSTILIEAGVFILTAIAIIKVI